MDAFPGFVYPSIHNATGSEHANIMRTLDKLPLHHVSDIGAISMLEEIPSSREGWTTLGRAYNYGVTNEIQLSRSGLTTPERMDSTLIHEIGHTTDYTHHGCLCCSNASSRGPWGQGPHITEYAKTNEREDFADSYRAYYQRPEDLKEANPEKFAEMERINKPGFFERLVDRKEFRETGKLLGDLAGPNKVARLSVEGGRTLIGGVQMVNGLSNWVNSSTTGDPMQHASGIMNTVSGALMLSGAVPLAGVGVQAANFALHRSVKRGELSPEEVQSAVALPARPLESIFGRKKTTIEDSHRPGKVLAVATGGGIGGAVGSMVGPYLGVLGGYQVAGAVGGAVGLVTGGLVGFLGGAELGGRAGAALAGN